MAEAAGGCLPSAAASEDEMKEVGLLLLKCILDRQPISRRICPFVLDYLINGNDAEALSDADAALHALSAFDAATAASWRALLAADPARIDQLGLTLGHLDVVSNGADVRVTSRNVRSAVVHGCARRLLGDGRQEALVEMRKGFSGCEDLEIQLAALGSARDMALLLQGPEVR